MIDPGPPCGITRQTPADAEWQQDVRDAYGEAKATGSGLSGRILARLAARHKLHKLSSHPAVLPPAPTVSPRPEGDLPLPSPKAAELAGSALSTNGKENL